jgi:hypothetical protein
MSSAISSRASAGGDSRQNSPDGPGLFGPALAPASPSVQPASSAAPPTSGTCGQRSESLSPSAALQRLLESRLRARLDVHGSPECVLIWKHWAMPSGPPICALRASARRTSGSGSGGLQCLPTPKANERAQSAEAHAKGFYSLMEVASLMPYPTPRAEDSQSSGERVSRGTCDTLTSVARLAGWGSPQASDHKGFSKPGQRVGQLSEHALLAAYPTPRTPTGRSGDGREQGQAGLGRRGPSDRGPWDDFTIVHCADGKARRLVSRLGLLVDGISHTMASTLANERKVDATTTTSGPDQGVQIVQAPDDPQANRNSAGGSLSVSAPEVLQPGVYGGVDGGADQGSIAEEQPSPVNETPRVRLSDVRIGREPSRASQGRQPSQQRLIELGDVVRHLPHAYTLARMEGDHATAEALLGVYEACPSLGPVQHALQPLPSAWRPADRQEIQRAWEAGLFDRFGIIGCSPLVKHFPSRVTALKGLGNAIVPTLAAEFLMAVMETTIVNDGATQ